MPEQFKAGAQQAVANVFAMYAEFLVLGHYFRLAPPNLATVHFLVMPVPSAMVDGVVVQPNDERLLFDATELAAVDQPRPDDYIVQSSNGLRRDVITAHLDVTGTMWAMVARKVL